MTDAEVAVLQTEVKYIREDIAELKNWLKLGLMFYVVTTTGFLVAMVEGLVG